MQMYGVYVYKITMINPLSPHDVLKHHFTSLKTDLIFLQLRVLEWKFPWSCFSNMWQFSLIFHPPQVTSQLHSLQGENYDSNSRLVVDEDDNGKYRLERVKAADYRNGHKPLKRWNIFVQTMDCTETNEFFNLKSSKISQLAVSASFEFYVMGYYKYFTLLVRGPSVDVRIWRLQTLHSDV